MSRTVSSSFGILLRTILRPVCPVCDNRMTLVGIARGPSGYDFHTFECARCDHARTALAVNDPMKSGAQGWLDWELRPPV